MLLLVGMVKSAGFTLVEILVAVLISATVVLGFSANALSVMRTTRLSEKTTRVTGLAQARMAELKADVAADRPLVAGSQTIAPFQIAWTFPVVAGLPAGVTAIRVAVSWSDPAPHSFVFQTLVGG